MGKISNVTLFILLLCISLTSCAILQQQKENERISHAALKSYINTDKAREMLSTQPLKGRLERLTKKQAKAFAVTRQVLKPVTQVMQGYILSEGHSQDQNSRSLVIVDPEREVLMVAWVDIDTRKVRILLDAPENLSPEVVPEMEEYAEEWAMGQLGMSQ